MIHAPRFRRGIGRMYGATLNDVTEAARFLNDRAPEVAEVADRVTRYRPQLPYILARVDAATIIPGQLNRWSYDWTEVELTTTGAQNKADGFTSANEGAAFNLCELSNDGGSASDKLEGPGWNVYDAPTGFDLRPIAGGPVVQLWTSVDSNSDRRWFFSLANVLDGICA